MTIRLSRKPASMALGLAATLMAALAGCGGQATDSSDAVVVGEPGALTTASPAGRASSPSAGSPAPTVAATPSPTPASTTPVKAEGWGTFKGQVLFGADAPTAKVLIEKGKAPKDPEVCAKDSPVVSERLIVDGATKGVKNAIVYLSRPTGVNDAAKKAVGTAKFLFDQRKCVFEPHVLCLMKDVTLTIKSSDPVNHNVNAKLRNNTAFNSLLAPGATSSYSPSAAERTPGEVVCDIHPWMKAWWLVLDHPYFAVTDDKGYFELKNVPAGTQKVVVWQEAVTNNGFVTAPSGEDVEIKANDLTVKEFKLDPAKLRPES